MNEWMITGNRESTVPNKAKKVVGKVGQTEQQQHPQSDPEVYPETGFCLVLIKTHPYIQGEKQGICRDERKELVSISVIAQKDRQGDRRNGSYLFEYRISNTEHRIEF